MKAGYEKPVITVEEYELNTAIATGCTTKVSLGPYMETNGTIYTACEEYQENTYDSQSPAYANFYENACTCYLSSGDTLMFTS